MRVFEFVLGESEYENVFGPAGWRFFGLQNFPLNLYTLNELFEHLQNAAYVEVRFFLLNAQISNVHDGLVKV